YSEDCLARTLMLNPYDTGAMRKLARVLADKGYVRASVRWMERAVELEPDDLRNRRILREVKRRLYAPRTPPPMLVVTPQPSDRLRYASAGPTSVPLRRPLIELAERHQADPVIQMAAGVCLVQEGNAERALEKFVFATRALASFPYAWAARCYVAKELGKDDEAIAAGYRAHQLDPGNPSVLDDLGTVLDRKGRLDEAAEVYRASLKRKPDNAETHGRLAGVLMRRNDHVAAVQHFEAAIRLGLGTANVHNNLGFALEELGRHDEAVAHFRKAVAADPDDVRTHRSLGNALLNQGKLAEGRDVLSSGLEKFPDDTVLSATLAWILAAAPDERLRDGERAVRTAERALQGAEPPSAELLDALAAAYAEVGRFTKAVETARQAVSAARAEHKSTFARLIEERRQLYERRQPFRMSPPTPGR
ncbi:MAG TPA: tetratricopeptide repeat protein, partial [Planctomycetota bacterium]|nr:tetratricopeptide repeat protein [Planctomycetota bacterium]